MNEEAVQDEAQLYLTIDTENNIKVYADAETAGRDENAERFATVEELQALIEKWPAQRTLEIHNSLPVKSATEFSSPADAAERIWKVVSKLRPPKPLVHKEPIMSKKQPKAAKPAKKEPQPKKEIAPKKTKAERKAERAAAKAAKKEARAKAKADAKAAKKAAKPAKVKKDRKPRDPNAPQKTAPREGSKGAEVLALLTRKSGATLKEIMKITKWQPHTTRGWLSTLGKKFENITVESSKDKDGERSYKATVKAA